MAMLRSFTSKCRKLSQSNLNQLVKSSQAIRSYHNRSSTPFINNHKQINSTRSAYKYLSSSYKAILSTRSYNGGQQFVSPYQYHHPLVYQNNGPIEVHATTIICVRKGEDVVMCGDGQMTIGTVVAKPNGRKLRKLNNDKAVCGFAGKIIITIHKSLYFAIMRFLMEFDGNFE